MREVDIRNILVDRLAVYGPIKWHTSLNHSFYIKFKDVRLGSIRIADHKGRQKYHYTYEIYKNDKDLEQKIEEIVLGIKNKSKNISNFDPDKFMVFDKKNRRYKEVKNYTEYKEHIWSK